MRVRDGVGASAGVVDGTAIDVAIETDQAPNPRTESPLGIAIESVGTNAFGGPPTGHANQTTNVSAAVTLQAAQRMAPAEVAKIETIEVRGRELDVVDLSTDRGLNLLSSYFAGYVRAFPDPDERMSKSEIAETKDDPQYRVLMLVDPATERVVGGMQLGCYETADGAAPFGEYLWVRKADRRQGIGTALESLGAAWVQQVGGDVPGTFGEFNDPHLMSDEELQRDGTSMKPEERLERHAKQGYRVIDAPYAQSPLEDGDPVWCLMLAIKPADPSKTSLPANVIADAVRAYHGSFSEPDNSTTVALLQHLEQLGDQPVALLDPRTPRSCLGAQRDLAARDGFALQEATA